MSLFTSFTRATAQAPRAVRMAAIFRAYSKKTAPSAIARFFNPADETKGNLDNIQIPTHQMLRDHAGVSPFS